MAFGAEAGSIVCWMYAGAAALHFVSRQWQILLLQIRLIAMLDAAFFVLLDWPVTGLFKDSRLVLTSGVCGGVFNSSQSSRQMTVLAEFGIPKV